MYLVPCWPEAVVSTSKKNGGAWAVLPWVRIVKPRSSRDARTVLENP